MHHFTHSGDLGDVIYALPTIKAMGGGVLQLTNRPVGQTHGMPPERSRLLEPLLAAQPYIQAVWCHDYMMPTSEQAINLDAFRWSGQDFFRGPLYQCVSRTFGLPDGLGETPWLEAEPAMVGWPVLIARSARYHNPRFPWKRVLEQYRSYAYFVGTPAEHAAFVTEFGDVPYHQTRDLYDLARAIRSTLLFIGNQSAPLAIAEGLGVNTVCEVCPLCPNCLLKRKNFWAGYDEHLILPNLEELIHAVPESSPA